MPVKLELSLNPQKKKTYVARITGRDEKYKVSREFLRPTVTDRAGSPKRWRMTWSLGDGLYETQDAEGVRRHLRVTGEMVEDLTADQWNDVVGWL